jgi:hypothetical protein
MNAILASSDSCGRVMRLDLKIGISRLQIVPGSGAGGCAEGLRHLVTPAD